MNREDSAVSWREKTWEGWLEDEPGQSASTGAVPESPAPGPVGAQPPAEEEVRAGSGSPALELREGPPVPETLEDTGLSAAYVGELLLRVLYRSGARTGDQLSEIVCLPFLILEPELRDLEHRKLVERRGGTDRGLRAVTYDLTAEGRRRGRELTDRNPYSGPAPVPFGQYLASVAEYGLRGLRVSREAIVSNLSHLVLDEEFVDILGPAINSGRTLFLYGESGNGKTSVAEAIAGMLGNGLFVPHAVEVEGQIIQLYNPVDHQSCATAAAPGEDPEWLKPPPPHDRRYVAVRRPVVMVGGELTLEQLELQYDSRLGVLRAPPQMKANGGVFVVDDFGRQRISPTELLNRWMIPLERRVDFLTLPSGQQVPVPFDCLVIFATNLHPQELVEEAFLRRIRYKVFVGNPSYDRYAEIVRRCCEQRDVEYRPEAVEYLFREYYEKLEIPPRACHPRDLVDHLCDLADYLGEEPELTARTLRLAAGSYFLNIASFAAEATETGDRDDG